MDVEPGSTRERVWDRFLTEADRAHMAASKQRPPYGFGQRPAILAIDNYRKVIGDEPQPLLEAIKKWPGSTGLAGWAALEKIEVLLKAAREAQIPVAHVTGLDESDSGMPGWANPAAAIGATKNDDDGLRRRYEIVEQAAPVPGEVVLRKTAPSAFFGTPLMSHYNSLGIDTLIVCGESTSGCVRASVIDARSYRFNVIVVEECVYDRHEASHAMNLFDMNQKYADVLPLNDVVTYLDKLRADLPNG